MNTATWLDTSPFRLKQSRLSKRHMYLNQATNLIRPGNGEWVSIVSKFWPNPDRAVFLDAVGESAPCGWSVTDLSGHIIRLFWDWGYTPNSFIDSIGFSLPPPLAVLEALQLTAFSPANDTIVVSWEPVEYAVLYSLCAIEEGSSERFKLNTTDTTVDFSGLEPGTVYSIKGYAWDPSGSSGDDNTISQITRKGGLCELGQCRRYRTFSLKYSVSKYPLPCGCSTCLAMFLVPNVVCRNSGHLVHFVKNYQ